MNLSGKNKTGIKKEKEPYPYVGRLCQVGPPTHQAQPRLLLTWRVTDRWAPLSGDSLLSRAHSCSSRRRPVGQSLRTVFPIPSQLNAANSGGSPGLRCCTLPPSLDYKSGPLGSSRQQTKSQALVFSVVGA
jgi:hypothetical protein